jgi:glycosyltransferase involved in cell wall biosynthesis
VTSPRRIAMLIDALNPRAVRSEHPGGLADALCQAGLEVELHWVSGGVLARLDRRSSLATGGGGLEGAATQVMASAPEAILAYDPASPAAWLGARMASRVGAPLVLIEPAWFSLRPLHERMLDGIGRRLWGRLVRQEARRVVAVDPLAVQRAMGAGFDPERIELIPTGVDLERFRPGAVSPLIARHRLRGRIVLHVGPLAHGRSLEGLVAAYARTVGQRADWSLVLAGEGPLRRRLETVASRHGVRAGVRFIPQPSIEELPGLLCAATMLALPAEDDVVRGRQLIRAMACGVPVLVSDQPRLTYRVEHRKTGYVVDGEDEGAWERAFDEVASSPSARASWARAARARVESEFAWSVVAERYRSLLAGLAPDAPLAESA